MLIVEGSADTSSNDGTASRCWLASGSTTDDWHDTTYTASVHATSQHSKRSIWVFMKSSVFVCTASL